MNEKYKKLGVLLVQGFVFLGVGALVYEQCHNLMLAFAAANIHDIVMFDVVRRDDRIVLKYDQIDED